MTNYLFWKRFAQGKLKTHASSLKVRIPSPKEILSWSERRLPNSTLVGKIDNAHTVEHDTLRPVSGGLFCERIFGPISTNVCACLRKKGWNEDYCKICEVQFTKSRLRRYQMGHILLAAPVIHVWALQGGYLASLLGKKNFGIRSIAYGKVMSQSKLFESFSYNKNFTDSAANGQAIGQAINQTNDQVNPLLLPLRTFGLESDASDLKEPVRESRTYAYSVNLGVSPKRAPTLRDQVRFKEAKQSGKIQTPTHLKRYGYVTKKDKEAIGTSSRKRYFGTPKSVLFPILLWTRHRSCSTENLPEQVLSLWGAGHKFNLSSICFHTESNQRGNQKKRRLWKQVLPYTSKELPHPINLTSSSQPYLIQSTLPYSSPLLQGRKYKFKVFESKTYAYSVNLRFKEAKQSGKIRRLGEHLRFQSGLRQEAKNQTLKQMLSFLPIPLFLPYSSPLLTRAAYRGKGVKGYRKSWLPLAKEVIPIQAKVFESKIHQAKTTKKIISVLSFLYTYKKYFGLERQAESIKKRRKRVYERGNILPFHQFILYKPDSFKKISQFFDSLNKKQIFAPQLPLPFYSKQKDIKNILLNTCNTCELNEKLKKPLLLKLNGVREGKVEAFDSKQSGEKALTTNLRYSNPYLGGFISPRGYVADSSYSFSTQESSQNLNTASDSFAHPFGLGGLRGFGVFNKFDVLYWNHISNSKKVPSIDYFTYGLTFGSNVRTSVACLNRRFTACSILYLPHSIFPSLSCSSRNPTLYSQHIPSSFRPLLEGKRFNKVSISRGYAKKEFSYLPSEKPLLTALVKPTKNLLKESITYTESNSLGSGSESTIQTPFSSFGSGAKPMVAQAKIKNVEFTGPSVLSQSLKNLNLVLLDRLVNWKWKVGKTQLDSFLLQNKLTKKKRGLRNKLAKTKIILTRRRKLIQSFLNTKQLPEWMILSVLPVLPPALRPILELEPNNVVVSDLNTLYQTVIRRNDALMGLLTFRALEIDILNRQVSLQQAIEKLFDKGAGTKKRPVKSLSQGFHGKRGLFRLHLLGKRVDYSGRSVIVVGPRLKLHECGLPKEMALVLFLPFLIARLKRRKVVNNTSQAKQLIIRKDKQIWSHLKALIYEHPVLLNRAPTLHRLGFQAFQPILVPGKAIILPALVCTGFNADFDGDQMAVHVPLSYAARAESWKLLYAKNNMLSPATGKPIIVLSQEMILGCYCSSLILNKTHFALLRLSDESTIQTPYNVVKSEKSLAAFANDDLVLNKVSSPTMVGVKFLPRLQEQRGIDNKANYFHSNGTLYQKSNNGLLKNFSMTDGFAQGFAKSNITLNKNKNNFYFTTFQEVHKALNHNKIALQTAIWLRIPSFEDNQFLEEPLEIRLDAVGHFFRSYGQSQRHFPKNTKSRNQMKGISYIRTSAGRIQLNEIFYSSLSLR